jgi:hypothetical protein
VGIAHPTQKATQKALKMKKTIIFSRYIDIAILGVLVVVAAFLPRENFQNIFISILWNSVFIFVTLRLGKEVLSPHTKTITLINLSYSREEYFIIFRTVLIFMTCGLIAGYLRNNPFGIADFLNESVRLIILLSLGFTVPLSMKNNLNLVGAVLSWAFLTAGIFLSLSLLFRGYV